MLGSPRRLAILAEDHFTRLDSKTAIGVLRYRPESVVAVIDSVRAGRTADECVGVGGNVPVVAGIAEAAAQGADALLIGIAPVGGTLPDAWRHPVREALQRGWSILSGLHAFLSDDPEFRLLSERHGGTILDVRRPVPPLTVATGRAADAEACVIVTVGTDCNVGKMTASLETLRAVRARGLRGAFVATGQTGIFIADRGVAVDAIPSDFAAGAIEREVIEAAIDVDVVLVEGQGSLHHPGYSGVTLSLLHGASPFAMVLCHDAGRSVIRRSADAGDAIPIPSLGEARNAAERAAEWRRPARVIAVALNTATLDERGARDACAAATRETGLPATDPVRFGAGPLAEAVERTWQAWKAQRSGAPPAVEARSHAPTA
jgi:D-glutamate N-acetyltransferase